MTFLKSVSGFATSKIKGVTESIAEAGDLISDGIENIVKYAVGEHPSISNIAVFKIKDQSFPKEIEDEIENNEIFRNDPSKLVFWEPNTLDEMPLLMNFIEENLAEESRDIVILDRG